MKHFEILCVRREVIIIIFTFGNRSQKIILDSSGKYSEEELVLLLQRRDQQAFSYLYDNYAAALNGVIYRMVEEQDQQILMHLEYINPEVEQF